MFEVAEIGAEVAKQDFEAAESGLRVELINAQYDLRRAPFSLILLLAGDDRTGCQNVLNLLQEWMDGRYIDTWAFGPPSEEERDRPPFWRYWRTLPPRGRIGLYSGAWITRPVAERVTGGLDRARFARWLDHARRFERALLDDGSAMVKLWLHVPKKELKKRLRKAERKPKDAWRIDETDWQVYERYEEALGAAEEALLATAQPDAPWQIIESTDWRHRDLAVARAILDAITAGLARPVEASSPAVREPDAPPRVSEPAPSVLARVDLGASLEKDAYKDRLEDGQRRLSELSSRARRADLASVVVFEGWDAAGKGGCIRRMTHAMDARDYRVVPIGPPSEEERARHHLWRFWRQLPPGGTLLVFDRSWYGRVLVERVEGLASTAAWQRAYAEIVDFELQLVEHGIPVVKFWLHIDSEEQLRRFRAREQTPYKKYKLTEEDYRNREKWPLYEEAVNDMVARTSHEHAPWHLVPATDKRHARVTVLDTVGDALERALEAR